MARYRKLVDVHALGEDSRAELRKLQPGQWVSAGRPASDRGNVGKFWGVTPGGIVVIAWQGAAHGEGKYGRTWTEYQKVRREHVGRA